MTENAEASRKEKSTESDSLNEAMMEKAETSPKNRTEPDSLNEAMMEKAETSLKNSTEPDSRDEAMRLKRAEIREGKKKMRLDSLNEAMMEKAETSPKNSTEPDSGDKAMMVKRLVIREGKKRMRADSPTEVMSVEMAESSQQKRRMRADSGNEATSVEQAESSQQTTVIRRDCLSKMLPMELILDICDNLCAQDRWMLMRTSRGLFAIVMGYLWKPGPYCHRAQRFLALKYQHFMNSYGMEHVFGSSHAGAVLWAVKHKQPELATRALQFRAVRTELVEMLLRPATRGSDACPELLELLVNYLPNKTDVINRPGVPVAGPLLSLAATRDIFDVLLRHGACPNIQVGGCPIIFTLGIKVGRKCAPLLLEYGADILTPVNGKTPLTMAAQGDAAYLLPVLTNAGVDIHAVEAGVPTALCYAVQANAENCVRVLLEGGSDPMARWPGLDYAHVLVDPAARARVWPMFLDHGLPVDMPSAGGKTMLMMAVADRQIKLVHLLLQRGADVTVEDDNGWVAVDFACLGLCVDSPAKLEMLSELIHIGCRCKRGDNDARWCASWRAAVASRCWVLVRHVLQEDGFDPCAVDLAGQNLFMHVALQGPGSPLRGWLLSEHPADAATWARAMRQTDKAGHTALYWAVQSGDARLVQRFLEMGAEPATPAGDGRPLLAVAARRGAGPAVVSALLASGADVHARDADGRTALSHAAENADRRATWEIVRALVAAGARDADADERGRRPVDWARGRAEDFTAAVVAARTPGTGPRMERTSSGVEFLLNEYF